MTTILALNSGSSSLKYSVYAIDDSHEECLLAQTTKGTSLDGVFAALEEKSLRPDVVGHRIVHGGPKHTRPALVDDALLGDLRAAAALAPIHLPPSIAAIEAVAKREPQLPQVVCFDTAFHASMPELARRYPLPDRFAVRRYGFHGLSYEYIMSTLGPDAPKRIVIAHLGSGASLVAVADGRSIDTTMGLTPTGGIMMGTRTGDLDPGVLVYLEREYGLTADAVEQVIDRESGLLAVGGSSDMKDLLAAGSGRARFALEMFAYSIRKAIGAYAFALGGLDLLVFTGGIGERAGRVRAEVCHGLEGFGIELDAARNEANVDVISTGSVSVRVIPTDEDLVIARQARSILGKHDRDTSTT